MAILGLIWLSILAACFSLKSREIIPSTDKYRLTPYITSTPTLIDTPQPDKRLTHYPSPSPTLTPITYVVVEGDTMLEIALHFGVYVEDLLASNPNVDPLYLSVGTVLIIPIGEYQSDIYGTPTPLPLDVEDPLCYREINDGVWCFALVTNNFQQPLEGISGKIELVSPDGSELHVGLAHTPINMLPHGKAIPMVTYFSKPISENFTPHLIQVNALLVTSDASQDNLVNLLIGDVSISVDGSSATISGEALIPNAGTDVQMISVVLVAYNDESQVNGVRRKDTAGVFQPGDRVPFDVTVYSLESQIQHVDVLGEAIPK